MTTFRMFLRMAALPIIVTACVVDHNDLESTGSQTEAAIQAAATARLKAQAAEGNLDAQEVLRGMERFAAMEKQQEAAPSAVGTFCDTQWRTMIHGETSVKMKVVSSFDGRFQEARVEPLFAGEGGRDLFLFCRDDRWAANHHLIWSNAGGNYLTTRHGAITVRVPGAPFWDDTIDTRELFDIANLDVTWSYFKAVVGGYAQPLGAGTVQALSAQPLNGNALWRCTPGRCTTRIGR